MRPPWNVLGSFGPADVLDVAFVAGLIYMLLLWFKRTKAVFVATGIFILAAVYVTARHAGMLLTTWILQGFFAIFLIALVVIFQEDLRSFFERLAVWSLGRRGRPSLQAREIEILVQTAAGFARQKEGALIILKGRDPLERHVAGGYELDGKLSAPILESIFDPHSEGHDGAVLIEGNRVTRFGAHLPLSKEFHKLAGMGTRHTAALGLAERTDALCLVVSEEKGTISVARDGALYVVKDLPALGEAILSFLHDKAPAPPELRWSALWRTNPGEKALSLACALALWLMFVQGFKPARQTLEIPVEARNLPSGLAVADLRPATVQVTLAGLKRAFDLLDPAALKVTVDLENAREGTRRVAVSERSLRIPDELRLVAMNPSSVEVQVGRAPADRSASP